MDVEFKKFHTRSDRSQYVAHRFKPLLKGKLLDLGCDIGSLKKYAPEAIDYFGIDIAGEPDLQLDLESVEKLPFENNTFDCTVCTDVLEHIDNLHQMFDEIIRVTKRHVIISLPNCWVNARQPIQRGHGSFSHYGLPPERPMDRHKWFFSISDILHFFNAQQRRHPIKIQELFVSEKPRNTAIRAVRRIRYPNRERYLNRYAHTAWCVFEKKEI